MSQAALNRLRGVAPKPNANGQADRLPPHSPEAERAILGCVIMDAKECMGTCAAKFRGHGEVFYDLRHRTIFNAMNSMFEKGDVIDLITLRQRLKDIGVLEDIGGDDYLGHLQDDVSSTANLERYIETAFEKWQLRKVVQTCTEVAGRAFEFSGEVPKLIAEVQSQIFSLPTLEDDGPRPMGAYAGGVKYRVDNYARGIGMITGIPTGYRYWDKLTGGLHTPQVIVIGGRPGLGKTSLAMNVAENVAINGNSPVGVLSMEMSADDMILRLVCARTHVNFHKLRTGTPTDDDLKVVREAIDILMIEKECPIYIDASTGLTIFDIRAKLRVMRQRFGIKLAIVDYLQLCTLSPEWRGNPVAGYGEVAKGIQASAKELEIPIILISQLSREAEKRGSRPRMSDLRESGDIEQVADFIGILWHPPMKAEEETKLRDAIASDPMGEHTLPVQMEICKNRNGPSGTGMEFNFLRWCMRFEDLQYPSGGRSDPTNEKKTE